MNQIHCVRLKKEAEALEKAPYPGELGTKIKQQISKEGWQEWLKFQTKLINENKLSPINPQDRAFLEQQMIHFLFEDGSDTVLSPSPVVTIK